ncbi:MAG: hypothetical protein ABFD66_04585 [Smithella sp.]
MSEINMKEGCMYHLMLTTGWNADVYYRGHYGTVFAFSREKNGIRFFMHDENIASYAKINPIRQALDEDYSND